MMRIFTLLGTPSVTLLALLVSGVRWPRRRSGIDSGGKAAALHSGERRALLLFAAVTSLVLYGSTLGYLPLDVYRTGFSPWAPVALAVVAIAVAPRSRSIAITALIALIAYDLPLYRSVNLFDYVVDPIVGIIALVWAAVVTIEIGVKRLRDLRH
jgi:hypothetical protein